MSIQNLTREDGVAIVYGGAVLGGGGGGVISEGLEIARTATTLGKIELRSLNAFEDDALIATISGVGAPAAAQRYYLPVDEARATTLLNNKLSGRLAGLIPCENGPTASLSGWISSAMLGIPVVDAPADGRAHPTGLMGAMGAHNIAAYKSIQAVSGGDPEEVRYVSLLVEGSLETNAKIVRNTSVLAGGMVKVARDPLPVDYLRKNAAVGGITQALNIGRCILENEGSNAETIIDAIADRTGGRIVATGEIDVLELDSSSGYTLGRCELSGDEAVKLSVMNEFMTLEISGERQATFPTLITLLSMETGLPLASSELKQGMRVGVLVVEKEKLLLGSGVTDRKSIAEAERLLGLKLH